MFTLFDKKRRGRPVEGPENKKVIRSVRLEKTLDDEFVFSCRLLGCSTSEGLRQAVILLVKDVARRHYGK